LPSLISRQGMILLVSMVVVGWSLLVVSLEYKEVLQLPHP
jgi:hypothetical protein